MKTDELDSTPPPGTARRGFLIGAGAASAVAVVAAGPARAASASTDTTSTADLAAAAAAAGPQVSFYVRNAARGEIGILTGEREVVITDRALTATLLAAAGS